MSEGLVDAALGAIGAGAKSIVEQAAIAQEQRYQDQSWQRKADFQAGQDKLARDQRSADVRAQIESREKIESDKLEAAKDKAAAGSGAKVGRFKVIEMGPLGSGQQGLLDSATGDIKPLSAEEAEVIESTPAEEQSEGFLSELWNSIKSKATDIKTGVDQVSEQSGKASRTNVDIGARYGVVSDSEESGDTKVPNYNELSDRQKQIVANAKRVRPNLSNEDIILSLSTNPKLSKRFLEN
jgi:hypothetical protein